MERFFLKPNFLFTFRLRGPSVGVFTQLGEGERERETKRKKYSTNKLKPLRVVYAYLISFVHNIQGSIYIHLHV